MAVDKLVDSTQLDADLTSVANAIRTKGGTSAQLAFPAGFVSAIGDIPTGGGGSGYALIGSGSYTYTGSAASTINFPVSYTGTPIFAYAVADEIIPSTAQSYGFAWWSDSFPGMPYLHSANEDRLGLSSYVNTSGVIGGVAINSSNRLSGTTFYLSRVNNANLIQPNKYNWYIYGIPA